MKLKANEMGHYHFTPVITVITFYHAFSQHEHYQSICYLFLHVMHVLVPEESSEAMLKGC